MLRIALLPLLPNSHMSALAASYCFSQTPDRHWHQLLFAAPFWAVLHANWTPWAFRALCKLTSSTSLMNTVLEQGQLFFLTDNRQMLGTNQSEFCLPWPMSSSPYCESLQLLLALVGNGSFLQLPLKIIHLQSCLFNFFMQGGTWCCHLSFSLSCWPDVLKLRTLLSLRPHRRAERGVFSYLQMRLNSTAGCEAFKDSQWQFLQRSVHRGPQSRKCKSSLGSKQNALQM